MAIKLPDAYPGKVNPVSADYPQGSFKNSTGPGTGDGTPLDQQWANDYAGFFQAILLASGVNPSGVPDTARASQYLTALLSLIPQSTPVGVFAEYTGFTAPDGWLMCDGSAVSRATYAALWGVMSLAINGTAANGSSIITGLPSTSKLGVGMPISGATLQAGTVITSIDSGTQIHVSLPATGSGATAFTVAPFGLGDGATTFNLPDLRGVYPKGAGTTGRAAGVDANGIPYSSVLGQYKQDRMQGHVVSVPNVVDASGAMPGVGSAGNLGIDRRINIAGTLVTDGVNGAPRTGATTEPQSVGVNFIIKY